MNPFAELVALYERWRALTEAEAGAIRAATWAAVSALQEQKAQLQSLVEACSLKLVPAVTPESPQGRELQRLISDLVQREEANSAFLARQLEAQKHERSELEQSGLNLRRLRHSYGQGRSSTWQSYS